MIAIAVVIPSAFGVLTGSPSKFEGDDGNMIVDTTGNGDWSTVAFDKVTDLTNGQDDSFTPGQKQDSVCPGVEPHSNPPKDDFSAVASYSETSASLRTYLYGATIRVAPNGNASENVELKQGKNGTCAGSTLLARTKGDKLLSFDYLNGGTTLDLHVLTWIVTSNPASPDFDPNNATCFVGNDVPPCWGANVLDPSATTFEGKASTAAITAANNPITNAALQAGQFAEFAVDLVGAGVIPANTCKAFPQTVWESRASGSSFVSTTKDISIENRTISNCAQIKIIKQTNPRGLDQKFSFTSDLPANSAAGGVACTTGGASGVSATGAFCLNDTGNTGKAQGSTTTANNSTGNTITETEVLPGTYHVTEGADPTGFGFSSVTCTGTTNFSSTGKALTVTLAQNDSVVCVYTNQQQLGAISVTKVSAKGNAPLAGASFTATASDGTTVYNIGPTNSNGTACVANLPFDTYTVAESSAPSGYAKDAASQSVVVNTNGNCTTGATTPANSFVDTPLSKIQIKFFSLAQDTNGDVTKSQISCTKGGNTVPAVTENGDPDASPSKYDDTDETFGNGTSTLTPGVYTCTIDVDP